MLYRSRLLDPFQVRPSFHPAREDKRCDLLESGLFGVCSTLDLGALPILSWLSLQGESLDVGLPGS